MLLTVICAFLSLRQVALCALQFQRPGDLPGIDYDFIVVGGGTAGIVVGSRLGEVSPFNILIIEAGPSNDEVFDSKVPGLSHSIGFGTPVDWNYTTTPQINVNGKVSSYGRAKILGGCSSHNEMAYTRGSRDDYDRWASVVNDESLSWDQIFPYILKTEKWSSPNDPGLSETNHFDPSVHDSNGKVGVSAPYYPHPFNDLLFEAARVLSDEFPFLLDLNGGRPIGLGWGQATVANGSRSSSATSYVPQTGDNVHILLNTRVTRVLPLRGFGNKDLRKVEFATNRDSAKYTLTAKEEVILSGGVINTPQILLNSGIGPRDELEALGIKPLFDNPSVGKNFSDQVSISISFATNLSVTDFDQTTALAQWNKDHTGRLALPVHLSPLGWIRLPTTAVPFVNGSSDPTGGPNSPHIEFFFGAIRAQNDSAGIGNPPPLTTTGTATATIRLVDFLPSDIQSNVALSLSVVDLNPISRGSITLSTSSPFDAPMVDPALLASPLDALILLEGILSAQRLFSSIPFAQNVFGINIPKSSPNDTLTNEDILKYIRSNATPFGHGVGTCSMAPHGAEWGVVDPEFRMRGFTGLRIVDASVIPFVTSGHTQAPVYAIAEWASEVMKRSYEMSGK